MGNQLKTGDRVALNKECFGVIPVGAKGTVTNTSGLDVFLSWDVKYHPFRQHGFVADYRTLDLIGPLTYEDLWDGNRVVVRFDYDELVAGTEGTVKYVFEEGACVDFDGFDDLNPWFFAFEDLEFAPQKDEEYEEYEAVPMDTFIIYRTGDISGNHTPDQMNDPDLPQCYGIVFPSGKTVINWATAVASVSVFDNYDEFERIHGHVDPEKDAAYGTKIVWNK